MTNMNISLRKEAYEFLRYLKGRNKSFSDVILDFKDREKVVDRSGKSLLKYAGVLKDLDIDWELRKKRMKALRNSFNKRMSETRRKMEQLRNDRS